MGRFYEGTAGADLIVEKGGWDSTISAGGGNDTISESAGRVSINAGTGNDSIYSYNTSQTVFGGLGTDTINLIGTNNIIQYATGDGNDVLLAWHETDTIHLTDSSSYKTSVNDNDVILTVGSGKMTLKDSKNKLITVKDKNNNLTHKVFNGKSTIDAIYGYADTSKGPYISASNSILSGTDGDDYIYNYGTRVTIEAGKGKDTVRNYQSRVMLLGEDGDDYIYDDGTSVTINAGIGDDTIEMRQTDSVIQYAPGDGNDIIKGMHFYYDSQHIWHSDDTIKVDGTYSTIISGNDVIIKVGSGSMTVEDAKDMPLNIVGTYESGAGITIDNSTANTLISGTAYADSITNESVAGSVTIDSGSGNDTIANYAQKVTIKSGDGNDYVFSNYYTDNSRIDAGDGNDTVTVWGGYRFSINGGASDDSISTSAGISTIEGGFGNDTISMYDPCGNLIRYADGDGNDVITGFGDADTLNITNGTISNVSSSGNDVIFKVGSGSIKVKDVKNIPIHIKLADGTPTMVAYNGSKFIKGIYNFNKNSLVSGSSNADYIHNDGQYSIVNTGAGNDSMNNHASYVTINSGDGNDSIRNGDNSGSTSNAFGYEGIRSRINAGAGDDYIFNNNLNQEGYTTVDGGDGNDTIENGCSYSTIIGGNGNDSFYNGGVYVSISGGSGNDTISNVNWNNTIYGGTGNDIVSLNSYWAENMVIQYAFGDGSDTVYGFNDDDTLQIAGSSYTTQKSGSDVMVKVGSGSILLKDVSSANIESVEGVANKITWTVSGTTAIGKIEGKQVAKITGLKKGFNKKALSDYGDKIVIAKSALTTTKAAISGDYTLALGDDVTKSDVVKAGWIIDGTSATYKTENSTVGYYLATDAKSITYKKAATSKELTTITGLSEDVTADDLTIDIKNKKVTVAANALGTGTATISKKYVFALDSDVTTSTTTKSSWSIDDSSAEYTTEHISEGYVLTADKKSITHNEESGGEMVATIDGLKKGTKASAFTVKNNIITVAKTALSANNIITLDSEDYTLAIGSGAKKSVTTSEGWHISGTTATYDTEKTTAGYAVFDDGKSIGYVDETDGGETLVKLTGLKKGTKFDALPIDYYGTGDIEYYVRFKSNIVSKNGVTVNGANSEFYTYGSMKIVNAGLGARFMVDTNSTVIGGKGDDYITEYAEGKCYLNGGAGDDSIDTDWKYNTLIGGNGDDSLRARGISYVSGGNGNDVLQSFYGENTLVGGIGDDTIISASGKAGSSSKNDILKGDAGKDSFYLVSSDNATIVDYTAGIDKVYLKDATTGVAAVNGKDASVSSYSVNGRDVILHTDSGNSITIKNGANKKITVNGSTKKYSNVAELFEENNFATTDNISDVIAEKAVGEFENYKSESKQENLITFAK